ncbi:MAG: DUF554 family protein [Clostridia bacterium]|nr:DUF554 family protein [Clostridia bacterium]
MIGLGTLINTAAIVLGGLIGRFAGRLFKPQQQAALEMACGISVLFIALAGAMQGMLPSVLLAIGAAYLPWSF